MIRIVRVLEQPIHELRYLNASRRGGTEVVRLPFLQIVVAGLPEGLDAIIATSDLQGIVPSASRGGEATLLGVAVADALAELGDEGRIPRSERSGVILAGDLYSVPEANKRGGHGCVADVWHAFDDRFAWTCGVAGNHDDVSDVRGGHLLDAESVVLDGIRLGGVGLVAGDPAKRGRRSEEDQLAAMELVAPTLDVLVLHEGPPGTDERSQPGNDAIAALLERHPVPLVVCGHSHWSHPVAPYAGGTILNVDARVAILTRG